MIAFGFNDTSTLVGHFVSSPREREKRDRRDSWGEERGKGRKRKMNENEDTEEIKHSPSTLTCCKDSRPFLTVSQYQLDALVRKVLCHTQPPPAEVRKWQSGSWKGDKNIFKNYIQTTCTSANSKENMCKVSKRPVWNCMRSCNHKVPTVYTSEVRKWLKFTKQKKVTKLKEKIRSKAHAHLQTMEKICAKFQKDWYNIVWGVVPKRYPPSIYGWWKKTKFTM